MSVNSDDTIVLPCSSIQAFVPTANSCSNGSALQDCSLSPLNLQAILLNGTPTFHDFRWCMGSY